MEEVREVLWPILRSAAFIAFVGWFLMRLEGKPKGRPPTEYPDDDIE